MISQQECVTQMMRLRTGDNSLRHSMNVLFFIQLRDCLYIIHSLKIVPLLILLLSHYFLGQI